MGAGGCGGVRRLLEQRRALTLGDADLWKLSILIHVVFTGLLALLAVRMWRSSVGEAVNGDVVDGQIRYGQAVEEEARRGIGALAVHVGVVVEAVFAGVLCLLEGGRATMAVEGGAEAGVLAVKRRQARVDAASQGGIRGLSGERLDTDLQRNTLGHVRDGENVL